jgi:hypothetical protein
LTSPSNETAVRRGSGLTWPRRIIGDRGGRIQRSFRADAPPPQRVVVRATPLGAAEIPALSRRRRRRSARRFAASGRCAAWQDARRQSKTALRSLAMEFTAIIVFTAIALWFVTEVGGENL